MAVTTGVVAIAMGVACFCGAQAFLMSAPRLLLRSTNLAPGRGASLMSASSTEGRRPSGSEFSNSSSLMVLGAMLAGSAVVARRRRVARSVTFADIAALTSDDVPGSFRKGTSMLKSRRNFNKNAITEAFGDCFFVLVMSGYAFSTLQKEEFMDTLPVTVRVHQLRSNLVKKAVEGTPWAGLAPKTQGQLLYVLVKTEEDLRPTLEVVAKLEKKFKRKAVLEAKLEAMPVTLPFTMEPLTQAMMADDWSVIKSEDIMKFKDFPTKLELYGRIAGTIKQVTTKIAKSIKQVPQKLAKGIKETVEKGEKEGKSSVRDVTA